MTFVNESCFATVPSCTVSGFLSGIHTVMTFALKKQKRLCRRTVLCGQQTGFTPVEENSLVMTFASESGFATMLWSKHFATQKRSIVKILLRKTAYSELCFAKWSSTTASWSKHFATQNGLRPPRFLRGAYFAVHKRQRSSLFLTAPFSSGCILAWSIVSRLLSRWNELFMSLFKQVENLFST